MKQGHGDTETRRHGETSLCLIFLVCLVFSLAVASFSRAEEIPPPLKFNEPPDMVVIPGGTTYVYMAPDMSGVYFYQGVWYRCDDGRWFRSSMYNGTWTPVIPGSVPPAVASVPPQYPLYLPPDYYRIRYHDLSVRWKEWERIRHWNRYDWFRHEMSEDVRKERLHDIEKERTAGPGEGLRERKQPQPKPQPQDQ